MNSADPGPPPRASGQSPWWWHIFRPDPPAATQLSDPVAVDAGYRAYRRRVLIASIIGYAAFYFVRKNWSIAQPVMETTLGVSKSDLGKILTLHGVVYGVSKFFNGFLGDRCNARSFLVIGLAASAVLNFMVGWTSALAFIGLFWMLNGWVQGMGFPPCARLLTHWFTPRQLPIKMSIWNTSHSIGGCLIVILCGYLVGGGWRWCFFIPAGIAVAVAVWLWCTLPDTPESVGLPEPPGTHSAAGETSRADFFKFLRHHVFNNKYIWLIAFANFFVYVLRYAIFDWGPTFLKQARHMELSHAGWMIGAFEFSGLLGALCGGWLTDRFFGGRPMRAGAFFMALAGVSIWCFWKLAGQNWMLNVLCLFICGFFIYGPQCLIGIAAANLATKRAAATAVGLTGLFGYLSTVLSGWGLGYLVEHHGWDAGMLGLIIIAALGTLVFIITWPARAHGYEESTKSE